MMDAIVEQISTLYYNGFGLLRLAEHTCTIEPRVCRAVYSSKELDPVEPLLTTVPQPVQDIRESKAS
jgi:hypothetical protein